jgi:predicted small metal-binding protein
MQGKSMANYTITCDCGHEVSGEDRREVEAKMWHHAIQDHGDMVKAMNVEQINGIMQGWDEKFNSADMQEE